MSDEWWVMSHEWWVMSDESWAMSDEWWAMSDERWVTSDESRDTWNGHDECQLKNLKCKKKKKKLTL